MKFRKCETPILEPASEGFRVGVTYPKKCWSRRLRTRDKPQVYTSFQKV